MISNLIRLFVISSSQTVMRPIKHYLHKKCIDKLEELGDRIDAIIVDGKIASDRSVMLILKLKRMNKNVKVFVLADRGLSEDKTRMMDYGADEFAVKPLTIESLINKSKYEVA
jgi:DNA-binding response OmpR family regulator